MWLLIIGLLACAIATFYIYVKQCHGYWEKRGIPFSKPTFFFGNILDSALGRKSFFECFAKIYRDNKDCKYVGAYKFLDRTVMVRDPELLSELLVKEFQHFSDNEMTVDENVDYIMSRNIFVLKGVQWKHTRSLLTPMFSSGKLKYIFPLSEEVGQRMARYIDQEIDAGRGQCVDGKVLVQKYTIDNVANCAFGIDAKAFEGYTKFSMVVQEFNDSSYINGLKFILLFMFPRMSKYLKIKFFKDEVEEYLTAVVGETLRYRQENNVRRNDFLDQIYAMKEKSKDFAFTDRDVVAQGAGFFVDGVETSAGAASYVLAEIARHQDVQKKVREEIKKIRAAHDGDITYEGIQEMHYLDAVINETLRMNGPGGGLFKVCTKSYTLPEVSASNKTRHTLNPGDTIMVPIDGIHFDPEYYPNPEEFKPERFMPENKDGLAKNTFMPFGMGPRHCIGMRFAILQIKLIVCATVEKFQLDVNRKMLPFKVHPTVLIRAPLNGFWFDFSKLPQDN